ncbi:hypothetical protein DPMN_146282 [Dreissena polymorpha]|uniref:Uncharacterized protein n=1 Tax=Dreissena polymorpha TaxID=45954 RepID=A0A9D4J1Y3_DREPO|nr:hypothetical protein DPMN_146282 [Dreissena polymorpha]
MFPEGRKSIVFHQDSVSIQTSKQTLQLYKKENVNLMTVKNGCQSLRVLLKWTFSIKGIIKRRLQKRNVNSFQQA